MAEKLVDIKDMTFEQALAELEILVRQLESGGQELDKSIENYSRGTALKTHCEKKLHEAKLKVEKIVAKAGEAIKTEEFAS